MGEKERYFNHVPRSLLEIGPKKPSKQAAFILFRQRNKSVKSCQDKETWFGVPNLWRLQTWSRLRVLTSRSKEVCSHRLPGPNFPISGDKGVLLSPDVGRRSFTGEIYFLLWGRQKGGSGCSSCVGHFLNNFNSKWPACHWGTFTQQRPSEKLQRSLKLYLTGHI